MKRRTLGAVVLLLALAGCGGGKAPDVSAGTGAVASTLTVTSDAFTNGGAIPGAYTCQGEGKAPTLRWSGELRGAVALAVVVDDPDAPASTFVHRVVMDLPVATTSLGSDTPAGAHEARNSAGVSGWTPPCPPSGTHHYRFTVYGLSSPTGLTDGVPFTQAISAIDARALVRGQLVGTVSH